MNIKKQITKEILIIGSIFLVIMIFISSIFLLLNSSSEKIINETNPTIEILQHVLLDITQDNLIIVEYLQVKTYSEVITYDKEIQESSQRCQVIRRNIEDLIISGVIGDPEIIKDYQQSGDDHNKLEILRNELMALHKEELATNKDFSDEKIRLIKEHRELFKITSENLIKTIEKINHKNLVQGDNLSSQMRTYTFLVLLLIILFISILIFKLKRFSKSIIIPIDETINKTREFVGGNYGTRIKISNELPEISSLQKNINNVFKAIEESSKNPKNKGKFDSTLLRKESHDIINFVKLNTENKKQTTITDLKKHLNITHPTILSRLKNLELKGFIIITKQGREKFISLTSKNL